MYGNKHIVGVLVFEIATTTCAFASIPNIKLRGRSLGQHHRREEGDEVIHSVTVILILIKFPVWD